MHIKIFDDGDECTYTIDISDEDAIKICNMQIIHKDCVELPSIGGNGTISNGDIIIMYKNGVNRSGSIGSSLSELQKVINTAMQDCADENFEVG